MLHALRNTVQSCLGAISLAIPSVFRRAVGWVGSPLKYSIGASSERLLNGPLPRIVFLAVLQLDVFLEINEGG
jgi:hypothetical protein